jgi:hypothetical protein
MIELSRVEHRFRGFTDVLRNLGDEVRESFRMIGNI